MSLDCKEIQPVHSKGNQSWMSIGRTVGEAETPILWPPDEKNWLIRKDSDAGKDWRREEKGTTEDEMVGWHHWLDGHEFEYALGVGDGQGSLVCCSPWGHKQLDMTERLNWTELTCKIFWASSSSSEKIRTKRNECGNTLTAQHTHSHTADPQLWQQSESLCLLQTNSFALCCF